MVSQNKDFKHDLVWLGGFGVFVFIFIVISYLSLTAGRGLESSSFTTRFYLYTGMAFFGFLFIVAVKVSRKFFGFRFDVPLHDPEMGLFNVGVVRNPVSLISLLVFVLLLPLFFLGKYGGIFFSSVQQISTFSSLFADSVFPAVAENLLIGSILLGLVLLATWRWRKSFPQGFWLFNLVVTPLLIGYVWVLFHTLVYSSDEVAQVFTFSFGFVGIFITVLTMSIIPWMVIHFLTNFVLSAKRMGLFSSDYFVLELVFIEIVVLVIFILSLRYNSKKRSSS